MSDITRIYDVIGDFFNLRQADLDISTYLGKLQASITDFNELMPFDPDFKKQQKQHDQRFTILCLHGIRPELNSVDSRQCFSPSSDRGICQATQSLFYYC